jgi:uncharacterized protein YjdB
MKKLLILLSVLLFQHFGGNAQLIRFNPATSVGFGASPWTPPAVLAPGLSTTGLIRGSSILTSGTPAGGCYGGSGGWLTGALDPNSFSITISAACDEISISSITGFTRRSGSGPNGCSIYYSLNGGPYVFAGNWTTTSTSGTTGTAGTTTLSSVTALQNIPAGTIIKFLINPTGSSVGNWYFTNTSLAINGSTAAVVAPTIASSPANSVIPSGSGTTFSVSGVTSAASYQWQRNTAGLSGGAWVDITSATLDPTGIYSGYSLTSTATGSTLVLSGVPAGWDGYGYRCLVTNCAGSTFSSGALLNVVPSVCSGLPTAGTIIPSTTNFCGTGSTSLSLTGSTVGGVTYQWSASTSNVPPGTDIPGATSLTYATGTITDTTYFWCTTTCPTSSLSAITSASTVFVHQLPVVTGTGGVACSGGSGTTVSASGAVSYVWAPSTGLAATTGGSIIANPTSGTVYTVTGTDINGCTAIDTANVRYGMTPSAVGITPSVHTMCQSDAPHSMTASGGVVGPTTVSSGTVTIPATISAFGTISNSLIVDGIPAGALITGAKVNLINFGSQYQDDYVINIKAPNGNILNLINQRGTHTSAVTTLFSNTEVSSSGVFSLGTGSGTFTGYWAADAVSGVGGGPNVSNISGWSGLFSSPNGNWTISIYNNTSFSNIVLPTMQWSVTLEYSYVVPKTWTPTTGLYSDALGTIPYTGAPATSVFYSPTVAGIQTHTVIADNDGCISQASAATTVNPLPSTITGSDNVCVGSTIALSNGTPGGTWSASNSNATINPTTGSLAAIASGTVTISYTSPDGCYVTKAITINVAPSSIGGTLSVCEGSNTILSNPVAGGTWNSTSPAVSIDGVTGTVTGISSGTAAVSYSLSSGCLVTTIVTVNQAPSSISGVSEICVGITGAALINGISGGIWTSSNSNLSIGATTGIPTGVTNGTTTVSYTLPNGCFRITTVTVNPLPGAISGPSSVCISGIVSLANGTSGGVWSVNNTNATATPATGQVTGINSGTSVVSYTLATGCYSVSIITVNPLPAPIFGLSQVCTGFTVNLSSATGGGTWSASGGVASVGSLSGVVTGLSTGAAEVTYTLPSGCKAYRSITVNPLPAAVTGSSAVCLGYSIPLSSTSAGGVWSASNSNATIGSISGLVTGVSSGTVSVSYTLITGCYRTAELTVNPLPLPISGTATVCSGSTGLLANSTPGGIWSSNNTSVAAIDAATGSLTAATPGTSQISYTIGSGCSVFTTVTVNPLPPPIAGVVPFCSGNSISLTNTLTGGTWSSGNPFIAIIGPSTGVLTGVNGGIVNITYTGPLGCKTSTAISISPTPANILAVSTLCTGRTTVLNCSTPSGVWISSNTSVATIAAGGPMTGATYGVATGTVVISYVLPTGCFRTTTITINPTPAPISGDQNLCVGSTATFTSAGTGGFWTVGNPLVASIASGVVTPVAPGTTTISYVIPATGCYAEKDVTVNALPATFTVSGGGSYCAGSVGAIVHISASQIGVKYRLERAGSSADSVFGIGSSIGFTHVTVPGIYTVSAHDTATGCSQIMPGAATVSSVTPVAPSLSLSRSATDPVCEGTTVLYTATPVNGGTSPAIAWSKNGLPAGTGATYSFVPGDGDLIKATLISNATCRLFDTAISKDTVHVAPIVTPYIGIAVLPGDTVCQSTSCTFVAVAGHGGPLPLYEWLVNGVVAGTGTSITSIPSNNDIIKCRLISNAVCATNDTVTSNTVRMYVAVVDAPFVSVSSSMGTNLMAGQPVVFTATVSGINLLSTVKYQWYVNGLSVPGATASSYSTSALADESVVSCEVTASGYCGVASAVGSIAVNVRSITGIYDNQSGGIVNVWPNPSKGIIHITGNFKTMTSHPVPVVITDHLGRQVYNTTSDIVNGFFSSEFSLPKELPDGIYVVSISINGAWYHEQVALIR